jgi:thiol-disulfide isomerase/thioredoxin
MLKFTFLLFLITPVLAQSTAEKRVLERVQNMIRQDGQVTFSDLHNNKELSETEKLFVGRLYEIFFQIPAFLKVEYESMQRVPTIKEIAASFGITRQSATLLLSVMESDRRMPNLFSRDLVTGEIESLKLKQIEAFIANRGTNIKITQWELQPLPQFEMLDFQGEMLRSTDLIGKNTLLYFWFTGCPPCVRIAPILENLNNRYQNTNFQVIGVNADRVLSLNITDQARRSHLEKHHLNFANVHLNKSARDAFGTIQVFPTLFFVSPDGTILHHLINFQNRKVLDELTQKLLEDFQ